ncbi:phytoene/squalene synthase family protein [Nitratireductor kimnyeongensis]|uniref:Phytoene/squalene synthase family protein n=1 Tax=Nitratireductor kimnyeongensis TaxID=430679 RepID=A0ABW0TAT9_9HYPH|nr:phytoene/squalene synthase family protein [Nitratireductor kimnyeongensis]QZZ35765.1 phytoene/squalene synthase family protein [Nitratireductor kimnyeongensis]
MTDRHQYIVSLVRDADPDRYLSVLYAPEEKRSALFALYAFNAEVAGIRDRVSEALPGEVRLQFWRDVLMAQTDSESAEGSPLAVALLDAVRSHQLPVQPLLDLLEARTFDLYDDPMPSRNDLEGYCGETASALIQLAALVLDTPAAMRFSEVAGHAGCAQAITGLLRMLPIHRRRGQCYIPADLLAAAGISREALLNGDDEAGSKRALAAMIALGRHHIARFEEGARDLPSSLRPAFLPAGLSDAYLERLEAQGEAALDEFVSLSLWRRHWLMLKHAVRGWR